MSDEEAEFELDIEFDFNAGEMSAGSVVTGDTTGDQVIGAVDTSASAATQGDSSGESGDGLLGWVKDAWEQTQAPTPRVLAVEWDIIGPGERPDPGETLDLIIRLDQELSGPAVEQLVFDGGA